MRVVWAVGRERGKGKKKGGRGGKKGGRKVSEGVMVDRLENESETNDWTG